MEIAICVLIAGIVFSSGCFYTLFVKNEFGKKISGKEKIKK